MKMATRADWPIKPIPSKRAQLPINRIFTSEEMDRIRHVFIPEDMGQKWFIFFEQSRLFIHRSWSGFCIYVVDFKKTPGGYTISRAEVNRDPQEHEETDGDYDIKVLSYCIDVGLLGQKRAFPTKAKNMNDSSSRQTGGL